MTAQNIAKMLRDRIDDIQGADDPAQDAALAIADALEDQADLIALTEPYATRSIGELRSAAARVRSLINLLEEANAEQGAQQ